MHQIAWLFAGRFPFFGGVQQLPFQADIFAAFIQPFAQVFPAANQGFMRHFDCRAAGGIVAVKGQQAVTAKAVDHIFDNLALAERHQF